MLPQFCFVSLLHWLTRGLRTWGSTRRKILLRLLQNVSEHAYVAIDGKPQHVSARLELENHMHAMAYIAFRPSPHLGNCMLLSCKGATNSLLPHYIYIEVPLRPPGVDGAAEAPVAMPAPGSYISMLTTANRAAASSRYRSRTCTRSLVPNEKVTAGEQSAHVHAGFKRRPAGKCSGTLGAAATPNGSCAFDPEDGG